MSQHDDQNLEISDIPAEVSEPKPSRQRRGEPLLVEIAWEVCNQLGGIYTVLRSKVPSMVERWGKGGYVLVGPYNQATASIEFEPSSPAPALAQAVKQMRSQGITVHHGKWLVSGKPNVILFNTNEANGFLHEIKYRLWRDHNIASPAHDDLIHGVLGFGELVRRFLSLLAGKVSGRRPLVAHFHEWMAAAAIPMLRQERWPGALVFTTHATILGRYLAMNDGNFYNHLPFYNAEAEASKYQIDTQFRIERAAAHAAHVFTTVSDVTGQECMHLLGRKPDVLLPNGLNIERFAALHEFQNLHRKYKERIHEFTMGHFFPNYNFDLDKTIYFYTSGRYEYRNKGMDLTLEALARLNHRIRVMGLPVTVINFIITRRPFRSMSIGTLQSHVMLEELRSTAEEIKQNIGDKLFRAAATGKVPDLNDLIEEHQILRLRRKIQAWKRDYLPPIVTHDLIDDQKDEVLNQLRVSRLWNQPSDPVKVIYHPDFITPANPLFGMEYDQFVRGCHLGVFPSYYEPWGYTPLESMALGVPAITSDLSGFGSYLLQLMPDHESRGLYVIRRREASFDESANELCERMLRFAQMTRRERIALRNNVESSSEHFDWSNLSKRYHEAHSMALDRIG